MVLSRTYKRLRGGARFLNRNVVNNFDFFMNLNFFPEFG